MKLKDIDPTMLEWLYAREAMRRLGFSSDDLFFMVQPPDSSHEKAILFLVLETQGMQFNWKIGPTNIPVGELQGSYEKICEQLNSMNDDKDKEFMDGFFVSQVFARRFGLIAALQGKGFHLPIDPGD